MSVRVVLLVLVLGSGVYAGCERYGYGERRTPSSGARGGAGGSAGPQGGSARGGRNAGMDASDGGDVGGASGGGGQDASAGGTDPFADMDAGTPPVGQPDAAGLPDAAVGPLVHRWSFEDSSEMGCGLDGAGLCTLDSVGGVRAAIYNATLMNGAVQFTGAGWYDDYTSDAKAEYVDLLPGILAGLVNATFFVWVDWSGSLPASPLGAFHHPRIFNLGKRNVSANKPTGYLYLSPSHDNGREPRAAYLREGADTVTDDQTVRTDGPVTSAGVHCFAVRFDDDTDKLALFIDGGLAGEEDLRSADQFSAVVDPENWLGRSPVTVDAPFIGSIDEFRIYDVAIPDSEVDGYCQRGPAGL